MENNKKNNFFKIITLKNTGTPSASFLMDIVTLKLVSQPILEMEKRTRFLSPQLLRR